MTPGFAVTETLRDGAARAYRARADAAAAFFDGHFPGDPVLPGVAQLSALAEPLARAAWPELGALARVTRLKFHRLVRPGDELTVRLARTAAARVEFAISLAGEPVSAGAMDFGDPP